MSRELTHYEEKAALSLCVARGHKPDGLSWRGSPFCPDCRAYIIAGVDAPPLPEIRERIAALDVRYPFAGELGYVRLADVFSVLEAVSARKGDTPPSERVPEVTADEVAKVRRMFPTEGGCDEPTCMCGENRRIRAAVEYCAAQNRRSQ